MLKPTADRAWARGRRWATALDDGRLIFRDGDRVQVNESVPADTDWSTILSTMAENGCLPDFYVCRKVLF